MLTREYYKTRTDGVHLFKTFSTNGMKIRKIGSDEVYDEAIDVASATHFYEETDEKIEDRSEN